MINLNEAKDLGLYKCLLDKFEEFTDQYPNTGITSIFKKILNAGIGILPKDKLAQKILEYVLSANASKAIQDILNLRFSDLPVTVRPVYKDRNKIVVAFWSKSGKVYDKVFYLLNIDKSKGKGEWTDAEGKKVKLIDNNL